MPHNPERAGLRCPMCGETAPEPAWLCLNRLGGTAVKGESCAYSVEAEERAGIALRALINEVEAEHRARASGIPVTEGAAPMSSDPLTELAGLCSPSAEGMPDGARITGLIAAGLAAADEIRRLRAEKQRIRIALHDAIRRPMGVTPDSAVEFYDQRMAEEAEARRPKGGEQ